MYNKSFYKKNLIIVKHITLCCNELQLQHTVSSLEVKMKNSRLIPVVFVLHSSYAFLCLV